MARKTSSKGVRLTDAEIKAAEALLRRFPRYRSESSLLHEACIRGLRELAIEAGSSGQQPYAGFDPDELADDAERLALTLVNFLAARGRALALLGLSSSATPLPLSSPVTDHEAPISTILQFDESAADDVEGLSGGFLEDD